MGMLSFTSVIVTWTVVLVSLWSFPPSCPFSNSNISKINKLCLTTEGGTWQVETDKLVVLNTQYRHLPIFIGKCEGFYKIPDRSLRD